MLDRATAEEWAACFAALGDPTRMIVLQMLAAAGRPMTVGEITARLDVGQSTVSHHLARLASARFLLREQDGTSSRWRVNERCLTYVPSVAEIVMGRAAPDAVATRGAGR